jgi:hypothetical protein
MFQTFEDFTRSAVNGFYQHQAAGHLSIDPEKLFGIPIHKW